MPSQTASKLCRRDQLAKLVFLHEIGPQCRRVNSQHPMLKCSLGNKFFKQYQHAQSMLLHLGELALRLACFLDLEKFGCIFPSPPFALYFLHIWAINNLGIVAFRWPEWISRCDITVKRAWESPWWMSELKNTKLEQGREITVPAWGNVETVAKRLRIYTRNRPLKVGRAARITRKPLPYSKWHKDCGLMVWKWMQLIVGAGYWRTR